MNERPKIKIELTPTDKAFELIGWLMVVILWGISLYGYSNLPDIIPTHFNGAGQIDDYGSKWTIFLLPIMGTTLFGFMTYINQYPGVFNYPVKITPDNAEKQYRNATRLIRYLKLALTLTFLLLDFNIVQSATVKSGGLGPWFLPLTLALTIIPAIFFVVKSVKQK